MKTTFALAVLAALLVPALAGGPQVALSTAIPPCDNAIVHEPVLVYELAGSTLIAKYDRTLTVFADGSLKLGDAAADSFGVCLRAQTSPRNVDILEQALLDAGALRLCDEARTVTDVPLRTLTLLRGAQDARAHTFSYWLGDGEYAQVDALIEQFIAEQFP